jgi:hypothetical protein
MERKIEEKAPATPWLPHPMRGENNLTAIPSQGLTTWEGTDHPYYGLDERIEEARCMLIRKRKTPSAASYYILRIVNLLRWFERQVVKSQGRLAPIGTILKKAMITAKAEDADLMLERAQEMLLSIIRADEDAKFPGCRSDDGELVLA